MSHPQAEEGLSRPERRPPATVCGGGGCRGASSRIGGSWVEGIMRKLPLHRDLTPWKKCPSGSTADPAVVPPVLVLPVAHGGIAPGKER